MFTLNYKKIPLYCGLLQQISRHQRDRRLIHRQLDTNMQNYVFRIWLTQENNLPSNPVSDKFKQFCKNLIIEQATSSSYHQRNGKVEVCIKFKKDTKNAFILNKIYI